MNKRDVLVAIMNNQRDLEVATTHHWYRIPVKSAPKNIQEAEWLAFYQTKVFGDEGWAIRHYARIIGRSMARRRDLLPGEPDHPRADNQYFRLDLGDLQRRVQPITSRRGRRIVFIPTTWEKFERAEEINDLFHESPLEDTLYNGLKKRRIEAERQFFISVGQARYCLDFAIFCQKGNIDVECDGDTWHSTRAAIRRDNVRNNALTSHGWAVLRFGSQELRFQLSACVCVIDSTIRRQGGIVRASVGARG
jgi:very-short-patch-repair endonuclease